MTIELLNQEDDEARVAVLKALADPTRLQILRLLLQHSPEEVGCSIFNEQMPISPSALSYHLSTMRNAGLTATRKESREKYVSIRPETFDKFVPGFLSSLSA